MDYIIEKAIDQKLYITDNERLKDQTWKQFEKVAKYKEIWIFGAARMAGLFWQKYGEKFSIAGVVDNDKRKQGKPLTDYVLMDKDVIQRDIIIKGIDELRTVDTNEVVVLVTSIKYYEDIVKQVNELGIDRIFVAIIMEANDRRQNKGRSKEAPYANSFDPDAYAKECMKYPVEKNKIFICIGAHGGHGRQISQKLIEMKPDLDIVWAVENEDIVIPEGIRTVLLRNVKEFIREIETAYMWIYPQMIPGYVQKRPEQIYIQIKHWASVTLKAFYCGDERALKIPGMYESYLHNNKAIDYILVGSKFDEETCRKGFDFHGECIYVGSPRTDVLFLKDIRGKVYSYYGINEDVHALLFCPTFRAANNDSTSARMKSVDIDFELLEETLKRKYGGEWIIFLRIHPVVAIESVKVQKPSFVLDTSFYSDSQELVAAADIVITDYSSIMFEPAFVGKPVFLYAPDRDEYVGKERNLLIDYDTLPFPIAESNEELMKNIVNFNESNYRQDLQRFFDKYDVHEDGHASERAAVFISALMDNKESF